jgi:hypothetical protein
MNRTTKIVLATGIAAVLGAAAVAGVATARDAHHNWRGERHHGDMRGMGPGGGMAMLEQFDANKDGNLTQAEIDQVRRERFAKFDANKDGKLSLQEFEPLWLEFTRQQMVRSFQRLDPDGDAGVTQDEYLKPMSNFVKRADHNNDGQLNQQDRRRRSDTPAPAAPPAASKGGTK